MYLKDVSKFVPSLLGFTFMYASSQVISVNSIHFGSNRSDNWITSAPRTFFRLSVRCRILLLVDFLRTRKSYLIFYVNRHWLAELASPYCATHFYILISCHDNGVTCTTTMAYGNPLSAIYPVLCLTSYYYYSLRVSSTLALKDSKIGYYQRLYICPTFLYPLLFCFSVNFCLLMSRVFFHYLHVPLLLTCIAGNNFAWAFLNEKRSRLIMSTLSDFNFLHILWRKYCNNKDGE
jgi:hypothetical protein